MIDIYVDDINIIVTDKELPKAIDCFGAKDLVTLLLQGGFRAPLGQGPLGCFVLLCSP